MEAALKILNNQAKKIAILIDPDKVNSTDELIQLIAKINFINPTFIFVGGSTVEVDDFQNSVKIIKKHSEIPLILFPGAHHQVSGDADGILFLSLISGRNPDFLIGHQIESAHVLKKMNIEVIPTGYVLIDGGKTSTVSYVSQTTPIPSDQINIAVKTVIAGEMLGLKSIFLDAGSGAKNPISPQMIQSIRSNTKLPLIIGGGIKTKEQIEAAYNAGADLVVIGNRIEEDTDFLLDINELMKAYSTS